MTIDTAAIRALGYAIPFTYVDEQQAARLTASVRTDYREKYGVDLSDNEIRDACGLPPAREQGEPTMTTQGTLRTGATVPVPIVTATMRTLEGLIQDNPLAFYDLVMLCRDATYQPFGSNGAALESFGMTENGKVHDSIRDVVLAAVEGDDLGMHLVSPYEGRSDD